MYVTFESIVSRLFIERGAVVGYYYRIKDHMYVCADLSRMFDPTERENKMLSQEDSAQHKCTTGLPIFLFAG
jgi:hypothetical protein